jgi:hypothetical protein
MVILVLIQYFQLLHPQVAAAAALVKAGVHRLGAMVLLEALVAEAAMEAVAVLRAEPATHQAQARLKVIMVALEVALVLLIPVAVAVAPVQLVVMVCLIPVLLGLVVLALLIQLQDQQ